MNLISSQTKIEMLLERGQLLSLKSAGPHLTLKSNKGTLWVTASGDHEDYVLYAGQCFEPRHGGKVVIEALKDAIVDIEEKVDGR